MSDRWLLLSLAERWRERPWLAPTGPRDRWLRPILRIALNDPHGRRLASSAEIAATLAWTRLSPRQIKRELGRLLAFAREDPGPDPWRAVEPLRGRSRSRRLVRDPGGEIHLAGACETCGATFPLSRATYRKARFCSAACRLRAHRRGK